MEIELWSGATKVIVDPLGAWITNVSDDRGDILFPKRSLRASDGSVKQRGGCHVCLPNFGPGGMSAQPQHGFGREMVWSVRERTDTSVVLDLEQGRDEYELLGSKLTYRVADGSLTLELRVVNNGEDDMRIAPAFHPYFAILGSDIVTVNGEPQILDDIRDAEFITRDIMQLKTSSRTITLRAKQLPVWAKWTDQLGPYVCIEPTVGGFSFLCDTPAQEELLKPGESKTYTFEIAWQ